ncbi:MFS transporter [Aggregicoccus sp. 17bor-14]|uniref:MFS transporter n=1 Tax=Myxococcaceae TaxID=31 RepID=UPI00129C8D9E|nr:MULTISPECIES: MFS transporter [Myxococcaceae]MBF5043902.1 MFS transporter [Simulacricoccus sp. 17bor-14]MRI89653.1 MFS transporter [Aggregicoccus sp. 17bor-14]
MPPSGHLLRALRHRNYRLFFSGQSVSLCGTWITRIATSWLVYRLTGSALLLGVVGFCGQIPTLLLAPLAGVFVDRWDRHRVLLVTQVLSLLQSAALAALSLAGVITVPQVLALQLVQGVINAFDTPARQAFVVTMIEDRADLPNAIALNSTMVNGSRIVGPSIGGALIAVVGEGWCFALDALSYFAVIGTLLAMRGVRREGRPPAAPSHVGEELRAGLRYVTGFVPVRTVLLLLAVVSTMGMPYTVLMPLVATRVLAGGPHLLGFLMTASGVGALGGALYLASRRTVLGLGRAISVATLTFGLGLALFALSRSIPLSLALMPFIGAGFMVAMASTNTFLQTVVDEHLRGRVMAFYTMAFLGTAPLGSLLAGSLAERFGAPLTIGLGGAVCLLAGLLFTLRLPHLRALVRPVYVQRGILAEGPLMVPSQRPEGLPGGPARRL